MVFSYENFRGILGLDLKAIEFYLKSIERLCNEMEQLSRLGRVFMKLGLGDQTKTILNDLVEKLDKIREDLQAEYKDDADAG